MKTKWYFIHKGLGIKVLIEAENYPDAAAQILHHYGGYVVPKGVEDVAARLRRKPE